MITVESASVGHDYLLIKEPAYEVLILIIQIEEKVKSELNPRNSILNRGLSKTNCCAYLATCANNLVRVCLHIR